MKIRLIDVDKAVGPKERILNRVPVEGQKLEEIEKFCLIGSDMLFLNKIELLAKRDVGEEIHSPASATICSNTAIRS